MSRKHIALWLAAGLAIAALVMREWEDPTIYSFAVSDFLKRDVRDKRVRVAGRVIPGTLCRLQPDCGYRFSMTDRYSPFTDAGNVPAPGPTLPVSFEGCVMPDSFLEQPGRDLEVIVDGQRCQRCHDFQATNIMARTYLNYDDPRDAAPVSLPLPPHCDALTPRM